MHRVSGHHTHSTIVHSALGLTDTIEAACEMILGGATRVVDAARCNGTPMVLLAACAGTVANAAPASRAGAIAASYHLLRSVLNETATAHEQPRLLRWKNSKDCQA